jgi:hypothetical protein
MDVDKLDKELQGKVKQYNTEDLIHDCFPCVTTAWNTAFRICKGRKLSYFSNRMASLCGNTFKIEKPMTMGCPQGSCSGPGFWNILYITRCLI